MIYKGKQIEDRIYVKREMIFKELSYNNEDFGISEIRSWIKAIKQKSAELKKNGEDFKDVRLQISADGYHCNDNGPDDDSYMTIGLSWMELETEKESSKRIEGEKRWIDHQIEKQQREAEANEARHNREVENAIRILETSGYKVTGKK